VSLRARVVVRVHSRVALRYEWCLEATVWHDMKTNYLGAYVGVPHCKT